MDINSQLDELFQQWKMNESCAEGIFIPDGHVDEEAWSGSELKLMVLLKEVNSSDAGWNLQQFVREKGYLKESSTWPALIRWTYGILHGYPEFQEVENRYANVKEEADQFLRQVYFANVKKIAGGSQAVHTDIERHIKSTGPLLLQQIQILNPSMVLCCGDVIFHGVQKVLKETGSSKSERKQTSGGLDYIWWDDAQTFVIRYHHPNAHFPRAMSYTYLMKEVQKIL
ncbi:hypothetical protein G8C92_28200 [Paenibacillus donghaensis]|uniref:hypothetical protein n=1 Tax=Paenibacillus donghaensis TaxID=414771 RepID=UPI001884621C|nr:hypothetical protein [Paenibacillus donghaensis]MBE9917886.1 hypothetical protein [Paenibacillus donghaensis]